MTKETTTKRLLARAKLVEKRKSNNVTTFIYYGVLPGNKSSDVEQLVYFAHVVGKHGSFPTAPGVVRVSGKSTTHLVLSATTKEELDEQLSILEGRA